MARTARRKRHKHFKLKKQTVFTIFTILLVAAAGITALSFFEKGTILGIVNRKVITLFGLGAYFVPIILISTALLFLGIRSKYTRPNVTLGLILSFICLLSITQNGTIGLQIWNNFSALLSDIGSFLVLTLMFLIGLIVLFNTSMDEIIKAFENIFSSAAKSFSGIGKPDIFAKKDKRPAFIEKLPLKPPMVDFKPQEKPAAQKAEEKKPAASGGNITTLATNLVANMPQTSGVWEYPPMSLLGASQGQSADRGDTKKNAHVIEKTLESFGIRAQVVEVNPGPAVTQYALQIPLGTKLSKITTLSNDLALALAAPTGQIRIEAPIPGRSLLGIEIPNKSLEYVTLKHMLNSDIMKKNNNKLLVTLGLDVSGNPIVGNIAKMPHVLIAGTTGSGKSVLINSWISSLLYRTSPAELRLILVDPKRVELTGYNGIPHLLTPVIVESDKILSALKWAINEMERRYKQFAEVGVRNIDGYNELSGFQAIPYIVIFIDELADLMAYAPVDVEDSICRLAQMARATGIHLVIATQRPSVDVITGLIKANVPTRIAFNVSSMIDSRVIMDMPGAEKLLGRGDMLYIPPDQPKPTRIQGTFVSEREVANLVDFLRTKNAPVEYTEEVTSIAVTPKKSGNGTQISSDGKDQFFMDAIRVVCQHDRASASLLQRRLSIGYARAARILDQLEEAGIVGAGEGAKPRDVLIHNADEYLAGQNNPVTS